MVTESPPLENPLAELSPVTTGAVPTEPAGTLTTIFVGRAMSRPSSIGFYNARFAKQFQVIQQSSEFTMSLWRDKDS